MDLAQSSTPTVPKNLADKDSMFARLLFMGPVPAERRMHVAVVGNHVVDDAAFVRLLWPQDLLSSEAGALAAQTDGDTFLRHCEGVVLRINNVNVALPWGDLIELWPIIEIA